VHLSKNISKEFISHVMKKFKLLRENGFKNSGRNSTATGLKNLFIAGGIVSHRWETMRENELWEQSTYFELYFLFCFISIPCLGVKIQTWRHHFLSILHVKDIGWEDIGWICLA
jgi:hypothetical protein